MASDSITRDLETAAAMYLGDMTPREIALRDMFVKEYLVDYKAVNAAIRCGFHKDFAVQYAQQFMNEPYVQQQLKAHTLEVEDPAHLDEDYLKRRVITSLLREAHYDGPGSTQSARVSALSKLTAILGMDAPAKSEQTITHRGGVMAVPGIASLDDWEKAASNSQEKLVAATRA